MYRPYGPASDDSKRKKYGLAKSSGGRESGVKAVVVSIALLLTSATPCLARVIYPRVISTGHFSANYADLVQGGEKKQVKIPIPVYVIRHPQEGLILFDSGLGLNFKRQLEGWWVHRFFQRFLPYELGPGETAAEQLAQEGIDPKEVRYIVVSHLHYDHAGGLADFPNATLVVSEDEWRHADTNRWQAALRGYRKEQYQDLNNRVQLIEYSPGSVYGPFEASFDLFGDGSLILLETPGHTPGHQSLLVKNLVTCPGGAGSSGRPGQRQDPSHCDALLTGDAVWVPEGYQRPAPKGWKARFLEEERDEAWITTQKIHQFHQENPEVVILTGHDPDMRQFR